jgi:hypothetical protein
MPVQMSSTEVPVQPVPVVAPVPSIPIFRPVTWTFGSQLPAGGAGGV